MKLAACQLPHLLRDVERALTLIEARAIEASSRGAALVCFPEGFLQGYDLSAEHIDAVALDLASPQFARVLARLEPLEPVVVLGLIEREGSRFYNTAVVIQRGAIVTRYRKTHLTEGEQKVFSAGTEYPVFEVDDVKVGINICNDLNFAPVAGFSRERGCRGPRVPVQQHDAARQRRRLEGAAQPSTVRARPRGPSLDRVVGRHGRARRSRRIRPTAVIDPRGIVVAQVPLMTTGMVVVDVVTAPQE